MATIPEGWFTMGCENGRDDEQPAHRVWIDRFELGIHQVTRAEYAYFLREARRAAPPFWEDPNFQEPQQPVVGPSWFDAVAFCEWLNKITGRKYRLAHGSGMGTRRVRRHRGPALQLGKYSPPRNCRTTPTGGELARSVWDSARRIHTGYSTWATTFTNGARTGMTRITTSAARNEIPKGPSKAPGARREAERGGTKLRCRRCAARSSIPPEFMYADYGFRLARSI